MATKRPEMTAVAVPTLVEAQAALARLVNEAAALRAAISGTVHTPTTRREERQIVTQTGAVERVTVDERYVETRQVSALERLQARRRLAEVELQLAEAEEAVEAAKAATAAAERVARDALVAKGLALLRAELPDLVRRQAQLQQEWQQLQGQLEALDQRLGIGRFTEAAWPFVMAPNAQFDGFVRYLRESYGVDVD